MVASPGAFELPHIDQLFAAIRAFDDFTPDNDPYGEHDCGGLDWGAERVLWKMDYYRSS
jgi:Protein of unknown function (DUF3768)